MSPDDLRTNTEGTEEDFQSEDLRKYFYAILNRRWLILTATFVVFTFVLIYYYSLPNIYTATTNLIIHKLKKPPSPYRDMQYTSDEADRSYYESQPHLIMSMQVLLKVAQSFDLKGTYDVASDVRAAEILKRKVQVQLVKRSRIISIKVIDQDPIQAANLANEIARQYMNTSSGDKKFFSEQILKWFPQESQALGDETKESILKKIEDRDFVEQLPAIKNDVTIQKLTDNKLETNIMLEQLSAKYTKKHPQMVELNKKLDFLNDEIEKKKELLIVALKRAITQVEEISNIKIIERAEPPNAPSGPKRFKFIFVLTMMSLFGSIFASIFFESLDQTIKTEEDLRHFRSLPILGQIPLIQIDKKRSDSPGTSFDWMLRSSGISDAVSAINTALSFSMPKGKNKAILITSCIPDEGKTSVAYLLAYLSAKIGKKVLLLDMDLRNSTLREDLKLVDKKGLADYLSGQASFDAIVHRVDKAMALDVVLAGGTSPNPVMLLSSNDLAQFIDRCREKYDRIFIDSPPSLHIPDGTLIAEKVDGILFVVGSGRITKKLFEKTLHKYLFIKSNVFGLIINSVNFKKIGYNRYDYGYYGKALKANP